jgi:hypothetical protein
LDLTLTRMRQIRSVVWARQKEARDDLIDIHQRSTRAIMQAVQGAAGNSAGMKAAAGWEMYPRGGTGPVLPDYDQTRQGLISQLGGGQEQFSWAEVEAMAEELRGR